MGRYAAAFFLLILLLPVVAAVKPTPQVNDVTTGGLSVVYPKQSTFAYGASIKIHAHVFNSSGYPVSNTTTNCTIHLYNQTNGHFLETTMTYDDAEWEAVLNATSLRIIGEVPYIIYCQQFTTGNGGYASSNFIVTLDGVDETGQDFWPVGVIILLPLLISIVIVVGANLFEGEEHRFIRAGLFLAALIIPLASLWYGAIALEKFYDWRTGAENLGTLNYVLIALLSFVILYWLLYILAKSIEAIRAKRNY